MLAPLRIEFERIVGNEAGKMGPSHLGVVGSFCAVGAVAACGEEAAESVVGEVAESSGDAAGGFNDAVESPMFVKGWRVRGWLWR